jgi:acetyltransferase
MNKGAGETSTLSCPAAGAQRRDIGCLTIRSIRPADKPLLARFHQNLSQDSVYLRYFSCASLYARTDEDRLRRQCWFNRDSEMTFIAEWGNGDGREIVGVGSLSREGSEAEVAFIVADSLQGHGIGSALVSRVVDFGRQLRLDRLVAFVLPENRQMQKILERLGFKFRGISTGGVREGQLLVSTVPATHSELERVA